MGYVINTYDAKKHSIEAINAPPELDDALAATSSACQALLDGEEAHLVAHVGAGQKWLAGYRMLKGSPVRITMAMLAADAEAAEKAKAALEVP